MLDDLNNFLLEFPTYIILGLVMVITAVEVFRYATDSVNYAKGTTKLPPKPLYVFVLRAIANSLIATICVLASRFIIKAVLVFLAWLEEQLKKLLGKP